MDRNNKLACPKCKSTNLVVSGSTTSGQNYTSGQSLDIPAEAVYKCLDCETFFIYDPYSLPPCPKCSSNNIKKTGPFAHIKPEGQPSHRGPSEIYYFCWNCEYKWQDTTS